MARTQQQQRRQLPAAPSKTQNTAVVSAHGVEIAVPGMMWNAQEKAVIRGLVSQDITDLQFEVFLRAAKHLKLNPFAKQIYAVPYKGRMVIQVGIDGFLDWANRGGKFRGFTEPELLVKTKDGKRETISHREYDPEEHQLVSATVGIIHADDEHPMYATCAMKGYAQTYNGKLSERWEAGGDRQLIKCCQALLVRTRFPGMGGDVYAPEEMGFVERQGAAAIEAEYATVPEPTTDGEASTPQPPEQPAQDRTQLMVKRVNEVLRVAIVSVHPELDDESRLSVVWTLLRNRHKMKSLTELTDEQFEDCLNYISTPEWDAELMQESLIPIKRED